MYRNRWPVCKTNYVFILLMTISSSTLCNEKQAIVISGGTSLGVYETGLNFVVSESAKLPFQKSDKYKTKNINGIDLAVGASAGAINSLVSGISACEDPENSSYSVADNPFRSIWIDIDLGDLLPINTGSYDTFQIPGTKKAITDAIFSRDTFKNVIENINAKVKNHTFKKNCNVSVGMMVTLGKPLVYEKEYGGAEVSVPEQSFVVPFRIKTNDKGRMRFESYTKLEIAGDDETPGIPPVPGRSYIQLPVTNQNDMTIDFSEIIRLTLVSSAFPLAFSQIDMDYCALTPPPKRFARQDGSACPEGFDKAEGIFLDGGYFNNIPLGPAAELMEVDHKNSKHQFIYLDPHNHSSKLKGIYDAIDEFELKNTSELHRYSVRGQLEEIMPGVSTLRKQVRLHDLHEFFDKEASERRYLSPTVRNAFISGEYLMAFGAFFDPLLREYDYLVGVYDGLHFVSKQRCSVENRIHLKSQCEADAFAYLLEHLVINGFDKPNANIDYSVEVPFLFAALLEESGLIDSHDGDKWRTILEKLKTPDEPKRFSKLKMIHEALNIYDTNVENGKKITMDNFLTALNKQYKDYRDRAKGYEYYKDYALGRQLHYMINRKEEWGDLLIRRVLKRLMVLEAKNAEKDTDYSFYFRSLRAAITPDYYAYDPIGGENDHNSKWKILPHNGGMNPRLSGYHLGWEYEFNGDLPLIWRWNPHWTSGLNMNWSEGGADFITGYFGWKKNYANPLISSFSVMVEANKNVSDTTLYGDDIYPGVAVQLGSLGDIVRLKYSKRDPKDEYDLKESSLSLIINIKSFY